MKIPLEETMATHSSTLAWKIPWTEEPDGLQSMGSQKSQTQLSNLTAVAAVMVTVTGIQASSWMTKRYFLVTVMFYLLKYVTII